MQSQNIKRVAYDKSKALIAAQDFAADDLDDPLEGATLYEGNFKITIPAAPLPPLAPLPI
jgi:hypothetical protein